MIIAIVTFKIGDELTDPVLKEKFLETSPIYKDTPGLIRKNYICDTSKNLAGGDIIKDKLLTEGILNFVLKKKVENGILIHHERSIKIKIGAVIQYEQIERGDYKHSGYCRERL